MYGIYANICSSQLFIIIVIIRQWSDNTNYNYTSFNYYIITINNTVMSNVQNPSIISITHRIHMYGIYANMTGVHWW